MELFEGSILAKTLVIAGLLLSIIFLALCIKKMYELIKQGKIERNEPKPCYYYKDQYGEYIGRVVLRHAESNQQAKKLANKYPLGSFILLNEASIWHYAPKERWTPNKDFFRQLK